MSHMAWELALQFDWSKRSVIVDGGQNVPYFAIFKVITSTKCAVFQFDVKLLNFLFLPVCMHVCMLGILYNI